MIPLDTGENPGFFHYILAWIIIVLFILGVDTILDACSPWWELRSAQFWYGFRMAFVGFWSIISGTPLDLDKYHV